MNGRLSSGGQRIESGCMNNIMSERESTEWTTPMESPLLLLQYSKERIGCNFRSITASFIQRVEWRFVRKDGKCRLWRKRLVWGYKQVLVTLGSGDTLLPLLWVSNGSVLNCCSLRHIFWAFPRSVKAQSIAFIEPLTSLEYFLSKIAGLRKLWYMATGLLILKVQVSGNNHLVYVGHLHFQFNFLLLLFQQ